MHGASIPSIAPGSARCSFGLILLRFFEYFCFLITNNTNNNAIFTNGSLLTQYFPCTLNIQPGFFGGSILSCMADNIMATALDTRLAYRQDLVRSNARIELVVTIVDKWSMPTWYRRKGSTRHFRRAFVSPTPPGLSSCAVPNP